MQDWIKEWVEEHRREVLLALLGVILIGSGVFWVQSGGIREAEVQVVGSQELGVSNQSGELVIDVSGEVIRPGVYKLSLPPSPALSPANPLAPPDWRYLYLVVHWALWDEHFPHRGAEYISSAHPITASPYLDTFRYNLCRRH